ncbi:MAG: transcription antitermination factor NusB [Deltaproteobacteria bacterium]|nr:transcription antitermination factor NusB [Deltaproteobacteria bacterium]
MTDYDDSKKQRRLSRELALRLLFQHQAAGGGLRPEECLHLFEESFDPKNDLESALEVNPTTFESAWPMAKSLYLGTVEHMSELDRDITIVAHNWRLHRMAPVDLALMRLAYYEMCYCDEIPPKVSLNEALEMAKDFGDQDSTSFINAILDQLMSRIGQPEAAT